MTRVVNIIPRVTRARQPYYDQLVYANPKRDELRFAVAMAIGAVSSLPQPIALGYVRVPLRWHRDGDQWKVEKVGA